MERQVGDTGPSGRGCHAAGTAQTPQVPQLEELQEEQEEPPPTATGAPPSSVEKQANCDTIRLASFWQVGQGPGSLKRLIGRISSNLVSQSLQRYS